MDGKIAQEAEHTGCLWKIAAMEKEGWMTTDTPLQELQKLVLLLGENAYAKVVAREDTGYRIILLSDRRDLQTGSGNRNRRGTGTSHKTDQSEKESKKLPEIIFSGSTFLFRFYALVRRWRLPSVSSVETAAFSAAPASAGASLL